MLDGRGACTILAGIGDGEATPAIIFPTIARPKEPHAAMLSLDCQSTGRD